MKDERSRHAIDVAERHANGQATDIELRTAYTAACAATAAAYAAYAADAYAAYAATAAAYAAYAADAYAASTAADAYANTRREQKDKFRELVS
jgi:hypothetical protein